MKNFFRAASALALLALSAPCANAQSVPVTDITGLGTGVLTALQNTTGTATGITVGSTAIYVNCATGGADSSSLIQSAITTAQTTGQTIFLQGNCTVAETVDITGPVKIVGQGAGDQADGSTQAATINLTMTGTFLSISTNSQIILKDLAIVGNASALTVINVSGTSPFGNRNSRFENLSITGAFQTGINFSAATLWTVDHSELFSSVAGSVLISNSNSASSTSNDSGDNVVSNSTFASTVSSGSSATGIQMLDAGSLRIVNNKFIDVPLPISLSVANRSTDLMIESNSIEGFGTNAILLSRQSSTPVFANVIITGNEFAASGESTLISAPVDANGVWLSNMVISNNVFAMTGSGSVAVNVNSLNGLMLTSNAYSCNGGTCQGNVIGSSVLNCMIGPSIHGNGTFSPDSNGAGCANTNQGDLTSATSAPAGFIGELKSATATLVPLTSASIVNVTSETLTPGHWRCDAQIITNPQPTTVSTIYAESIATTSSGLNSGTNGLSVWRGSATGAGIQMPVGPVFFNFTTSTSVFLNALMSFSGSKLTATGELDCQRIF
jgi:hypothetical protein